MPVVLVEKQTPQITVLTLNRPERRNALTIELMTELTSAIEDAAADPKQRILILRGAGKAFCTGLDLEAAADSSKAHATALSRKRAWLRSRPFTAPLSLAARASCPRVILLSPPSEPRSAIPKLGGALLPESS